MLGIMEVIMEQMDQNNNIIKTNNKIDINKIFKILILAMMSVSIIIAIILIVSLIFYQNNIKKQNYKIETVINEQNILNESSDESLNKFIYNYFNSRTNLNINQIFSSFDNENNDTETKNKIINDIMYERSYIKKFDDIKIYTVDGLKDNEIVAIIQYNILFGYVNDKLPTITMA